MIELFYRFQTLNSDSCNNKVRFRKRSNYIIVTRKSIWFQHYAFMDVVIFVSVCFSCPRFCFKKGTMYPYLVVYNQLTFWSIKTFSGWIRNRLLSAGLGLILSHTEKSLYQTQLSPKIIKSLPILIVWAYSASWLTKLVLILKFFVSVSAKSCL